MYGAGSAAAGGVCAGTSQDAGLSAGVGSGAEGVSSGVGPVGPSFTILHCNSSWPAWDFVSCSLFNRCCLALSSRSSYFGWMVVLNPRLAPESPVKELPKVKPLDQKRLAALGILTVRDLLLHLPFGWDSFGDPKPIADLEIGTLATVVGSIVSIAPKIS